MCVYMCVRSRAPHVWVCLSVLADKVGDYRELMIAHPTNCQIRVPAFLFIPTPTPLPLPALRPPKLHSILIPPLHCQAVTSLSESCTAPPTTTEKKKGGGHHRSRLLPLLPRLYPTPQPLLSSGLIAGSVLLCFSQHEKTLSRWGEEMYPPSTKGREEKERNCLLQLLCRFFFSPVLKSEQPLQSPPLPSSLPPHSDGKSSTSGFISAAAPSASDSQILPPPLPRRRHRPPPTVPAEAPVI